MAGNKPHKIPGPEADKLRKRYAEAKRKGKVITGCHVDTNKTNTEIRPAPSREISELSEDEQKQVEDLKAVRKTEGMLVLRRFGYTQEENPHHTVVMMGPLACGSFTSAKLVPSAKEVLRELVQLGNSSDALPKLVAVDDQCTATAVNEVTKRAEIFTTTYPVPSVEEQALMKSLPSSSPLGTLAERRDSIRAHLLIKSALFSKPNCLERFRKVGVFKLCRTPSSRIRKNGMPWVIM